MIVRMLTSVAGVDFSVAPGQEIDFPDETAKRYLEAGMAEPVRQAKVEKATTRKAKD